MIVLNNSRCTCIDVIHFNEIPQFLHDASEILTGFITFAKGEKMVFPIAFLLNKIKFEYSEIEYEDFNVKRNEYVKFIIRIREMEVFNAFEIKIATMELPGKVTDIAEIDVPGLLQVLCTFNAIPASREKGVLQNASKKQSV
jgi:hypothetical protein